MRIVSAGAVPAASIDAMSRVDAVSLMNVTDTRAPDSNMGARPCKRPRFVGASFARDSSIDARAQLIKARGAVAEKPKLSAFAAQMQGKLSETLEIDASQVNVKAKTANGLGSLGHGEGIAAQAIVTIVRAPATRRKVKKE